MQNVQQAGLPMLGYQLSTYNIHSARPEPLILRWAGRQFEIPAVDIVGPNPAHFDTGEPIPGTLALQDGWTMGPDGTPPEHGSAPNWSAFNAIRNVLGVDPVTKQALGVAAKAGISFLPNTPTRDVVAAIRADGERRYMAYLIDWANAVVQGYTTTVQKCKEAGVGAPPPSADYLKAITILKKRQKEIEAEHGLSDEQPAATDDEVAFLAYAKAKAMELAEKAAAGMQVDKTKLADELLQDPEVRNNLKRQYNYRIRKAGHLDVPVPEEEGA